MTDPAEGQVLTPQQRAAELTERIVRVEADLAYETRGTDIEEQSTSLAVGQAQANLNELRRALQELRVQYPTELARQVDGRDVVVSNPDDPLGPPIYEGPSTRAHDYLAPGFHRATAVDDGDQTIYTLHVRDTESDLYLRADNEADERANAPAGSTRAKSQNDRAASAAATPSATAAIEGTPRTGMRISIAGNVAAEPTFGLTQDGRSWARLRVASHDRVRDSAGQWTSTPPSYTEVVIFGRAAEDAVNTLQIGDPVQVQGRPEVQAFTRRDGTPGAGMKVFATAVTRRDTESVTTDQAVSTRADRTADRAIGLEDTARPAGGPVIHHTQAHTVAVGVTRDDKDVQAALKGAGFRWSAPRGAWYLPASMDHHQRSLRVDTASRGGTIAVSDAPPPNATVPAQPGSVASHQGSMSSSSTAAPQADLSPEL